MNSNYSGDPLIFHVIISTNLEIIQLSICIFIYILDLILYRHLWFHKMNPDDFSDPLTFLLFFQRHQQVEIFIFYYWIIIIGWITMKFAIMKLWIESFKYFALQQNFC